MKKRIIVCMLLLGIGMQSYGEGIKFFKGTWEEVLVEASKQGKPIFVDFYATWCGPCIRLSKEVFTQDAVGNFFNENVISFKVDAEKEELTLVEEVGLDAYPTLVFFNAEGKVVKKHVGYIEEEALVGLARQVSSYKNLKQTVLSGKASRMEMISYLSMAKDDDAVTFQELAPALVASFSVEDLKQPEAWAMYTACVSDVTSKDFDKALTYAGELYAAHGNYIDFVSEQMTGYMTKIVEANDIDGISIYAKNMERLFNALMEEQKSFEYYELMASTEFYLQREDITRYASYLIKWVDTYFLEDWEKLSENARELSSQSTNKTHQEKALSWAKEAVKLERNVNSVYVLAVVYENIGQKSNALKTAKELLAFDLDEENRDFVKEYIEHLKN
jgi:thiol-disulfide isomerase/thioredoxin